MEQTVKHLVKLWHIKADNDLLTAENEFKAEQTAYDIALMVKRFVLAKIKALSDD
jgi:hypothetical protein